ncbi:MAG TPA: phosphoribosylaminoimidazolesuccinocarboxamide synthase [Candidatus Methylacidiphilales bacterium]|jgi:phosphoribosylaminoimidazole-succinocarboxamide synthase|nr:phosphoribosylaminoimidazolesuccinocarboxamide synthase [Candidatus Methylacidiphilales bacterium]
MDSFEDRLARAGVKLLRSGKVRDIYAQGGEIWLVASDRISAYDVVMPTLIPDKGKILTALSRHWFGLTQNLCPNHVLGYDLPVGAELPEFEGRLTRARRCEIFPVECVARGHLAGSGWEEYRTRGTVGGHAVPKGLRESDRLPEPLFTPARKNDRGHDENLTPEEARAALGAARYDELCDLTLDLYIWAAAYAAQRGIILADTKLEFGHEAGGGRVLLADEIFTPDSSRFWPADSYRPGGPQPSFDKQYLRDYLKTLTTWNKTAPGPELPEEVVKNTRAKYLEALERLTR